MRRKRPQSNRQSPAEASLKPDRGPHPQRLLFAALLLVVCIVVAATHWPALSAQAVSFDDHQYFIRNELVRNPGWTSAGRFLTEVLKPSTVHGYYQPLSMISLMLDVAMGASEDNLRPFHVTSLCLHLINTSLVVLLLYLLFGNVWPALMVGLLFGVHPMTVETIPWVGERKTLLASFFALSSIILYLGYARRHYWTLYAACVLTYLLALMAKPTATPLPLLLLLLDFWPLKRLSRRSLVEKIPLLIVMAVFAFITVVSQKAAARAEMPGKHNLVQTLLVVCHNIIFYPYKMLWPVDLSSHYPLPRPVAISHTMILVGVIGTSLLLPVLLLSLRWTRALFTGWLFFFVGIFPTMGVIGFTNVIASDKFAYLPSVGLLIVLAWVLGWLWARTSDVGPRALILVAILVLASSESVATRRYLVHWRDSDSLYTHMLALAPQAAELHDNFGALLAQQERLDEALTHLATAVKLNPRNPTTQYNLALLLTQKAEYEQAIPHFRKSLQLDPDNPFTLINLAFALTTTKDPQFRDDAEAVRLAERACELTGHREPQMLDILAQAYAKTGNLTEAVNVSQKAIDLCLLAGHKTQAKDIALRQKSYKLRQLKGPN